MTPNLEALKFAVDTALEKNLPTHSDIAQPVVDAMRHAVLGGGKRIRPMLVCATTQAFGASIQYALPAACALEYIHAYSLIHDDLPAMDDDELRHGLPSAHIAFGEANAILAGDSLHSLAFQTIAASEYHSAATRLKLIELLAHAAGWAGMAGGQCLDIAAEGERLGLSQLQQLHAAKTGALIRVAVQSGVYSALDGQHDEETYLLLTEFGDRIGLAFQVMDDILDVTADTSTLGKPAGSDVAKQKSTFPQIMGIQQAKDLAETLVTEARALLGRTKLDVEWLDEIAQLIVARTH